MNRLALGVAVLLCSGTLAHFARADVILFDGAFENGAQAYQNTDGVSVTIDTTAIDPLSGQATLKLTEPSSSTHQIGIAYNTAKVPLTTPYLSFDISDSGATIYVQENGGGYHNANYSTTSIYYTVDGVPAATPGAPVATDGQWHHVVLNFGAAFGTDFTNGTKLLELAVQGNANSTAYLANVAFTTSPTGPAVPEPASLGLLALGSLALLRRRTTKH